MKETQITAVGLFFTRQADEHVPEVRPGSAGGDLRDRYSHTPGEGDSEHIIGGPFANIYEK